MRGVLITGGAGTLGREITRVLHESDPTLRIVIYSRDEGKHAAMSREFPEGGPVGIRYMLGDIRDYNRLTMAMTGCDTVIHAASMKMIDRCEYDAWEAVGINVHGTQIVAQACQDMDVENALFISTDKSPAPVSTYGRTKAMAEDIWIHANNYGKCNFHAVRYGNVIAAAKSAFHTWQQQAALGNPVTVTSMEATRFFWEAPAAADFCVDHIVADPGCIYIPRMHSYRIADVARSYSENIVVTGWRCPEKTHEELWTDWENQNVRDHGDYYCLYPATHSWGDIIMTGTPVLKPVCSGDDPQPWTREKK